MNATYTDVTDSQTELKATDRCDRCGARATNRAVLANGLELLFCGHHAREYSTALAEKDIVLT